MVDESGDDDDDEDNRFSSVLNCKKMINQVK